MCPFVADSSDRLDYVGRLTTVGTIIFAQLIYISGDGLTFILGIGVNAMNAINIVSMMGILVSSTHWFKLKLKNHYSIFEFSEFDPETNFSPQVYSKDATLVWDLHREFKFRVWHPFWNGMLTTLQQLDEEPHPDKEQAENGEVVHPLMDPVMDRWEILLGQVEDAGIDRIYDWLYEHNPQVSGGTKGCEANVEGIDVWCPPDLLDNKPSGSDAFLLDTARGGDKVYDSPTCYGKMYMKTFPPCATVVFDDSDDVMMLYNSKAAELYDRNMDPAVQQVKETRRRIKATHGVSLHYPMKVNKSKTLTHSVRKTRQRTDKDGHSHTEHYTETEHRTITVLFSFTNGTGGFGQDDFEGCMKTLPSGASFNTARGFTYHLNYHDGHGSGSATFSDGHVEHGNWTTEPHAAALFGGVGIHTGGLGFDHSFARGEAYRKLLTANQGAWAGRDVQIEVVQQEYRDTKLKERAVQQRILSDYFWTHIYNNCDIDQETLTRLLPTIGGNVAGSDRTLTGMLADQQNAFKYLWARWKYCKRDDRLLWWFIFWDDFWANNYDMGCLEGKADKLGPSTPDSIMYNCMPKDALKKFLGDLGLYDDSNGDVGGMCSGGSGDKLFFPALIDRMYTSMEF